MVRSPQRQPTRAAPRAGCSGRPLAGNCVHEHSEYGRTPLILICSMTSATYMKHHSPLTLARLGLPTLAW